MIDAVLAKIFGTQNERDIKAIRPQIAAINALEPELQKLSDIDLAAKTIEFKERLAQGATLDDLLVEAFALVREAGRRVLKMRHFDEQLIGGVVLHQGKIAEMKTGEGKTLVATLPVYLNALEGKGVHVVTVNDYLAKRDSEWMGRLYKFLGLTVGVIVHDLDDQERKAAYACDITYGTNNEFGFDYLRDNMKFRIEDCVQREHHYAIVDEVDSILIDEARTPLIISGPSEESTDKYYKINRIIPKLEKGEVHDGKEPGEKWTTGDYTVDEKHRSVALTEQGVTKVEKLLNIENLYDPAVIEINHHVQQSLRAHVLYLNDREYVVKDGQVIIVDEFTGRLMPGRRWSDGLHQAVEAKERRENRARESDAGDHHVPELFPHVQEAGRHDRYGRDRSGGIREDLQAGRDRDSDPYADGSHRQYGPGLSHRRGKIPQRGQGDQGAHRRRAAGAGRHHFGGKVRKALRHSEKRWASSTKC